MSKTKTAIELQEISLKSPIQLAWNPEEVPNPTTQDQQIYAVIQRYLNTFPEKLPEFLASGQIRVVLRNGQFEVE